MTQDARIKVAFVGAGGMGREHAKAFAGLPGVALAGVSSRTRARAEALAGEFGMPVVADSVAELHERTGADLVVVAVPEMSARAVATDCFARPWAVFLEKPAGFDLADAEAIARMAEGGRAWVGLNRRHIASTRAVLDDLAADVSPRFIQIFDQQDLAAARSFGHPETVIRNWMYANSIHLVDYAPTFGRGRVVAVEPVLPWTPDRPGPVAALIRFESGDAALYQAVWNAPGPWSCVVTTPRRRWELRPLERATYQEAGSRQLHQVEPCPLDQDYKPGFRRQAEELVAALEGRPTRVPTVAEALRTMRLVAAVYGLAPTGPTGL